MVGAPGSTHDNAVFKHSTIGSKILETRLDTPGPKVLLGSTVVMPHFFVADQAFPLSSHIMRPFAGQALPEAESIFNYRLSRSTRRRVIENVFGILAQRWRILRSTIIADIDTCEEIVKAIIVLHNYLQASEAEIPANERRYCPHWLCSLRGGGTAAGGSVESGVL
ncbi:unnamed protein product [Acanthoscelides obtectus]|uniref:DDE Tnp4 domain-containing protein n=1 Tax=Acanthoscelides obtectus TaxID=200917 RepID=A0A9P0L584_ACAOB|nr:unnamed protein product [Acanthoscelides obtectus]CAK1671746.1 Putative nuclease HARBI1 [Acanthoscelides obtectus]